MERELVARVRSFNRVVGERIGALEGRFLGRDRPMGASRVLWEIGPDGRDVAELRSGLGLDSGYLARLLRSLERERLVTVEAGPGDGRRRRARLTGAGAAERAELDRRSDELAASLLAPLDDAERARLAGAMAEVERLLTAAAVTVGAEDPAGPDARRCLEAYAAELDRRFGDGFDAALSRPADDDDLRPPAGLLLVARLRGRAVGCGALRLPPGEPADLKRMWVEPGARGIGLGRRILRELEARAAEAGAPAVRLETNAALTEAIALYRRSGYREVAPFNDEPYADHWFEKPLARGGRRGP